MRDLIRTSAERAKQLETQGDDFAAMHEHVAGTGVDQRTVTRSIAILGRMVAAIATLAQAGFRILLEHDRRLDALEKKS